MSQATTREPLMDFDAADKLVKAGSGKPVYAGVK